MNNAGLALAPAPVMIVRSDLLGSLEMRPEEVLEFSAGLFGFPECRSFVLVPAERDGLYWLQSTDHSTLSFLLADPFLFYDGYAVELSPQDLEMLRAQDPTDVLILAIVTLPRSRDELPTANLQGPLAINMRGQVALQLALVEGEFGLRCPLRLTDRVE